MRRQLLISYLVLTLVVLAALEIPLGLNYADHQRDELQSGLQRDAFVLASFAADTLGGHGDVDLQQLVDSYSSRTGGRVVIVDADGNLSADSDAPIEGPRSFADRPEIAEALNRQVVTGSRPSETLGTGLLFAAVPVAVGDRIEGAVRITYSTEQVDRRIRGYWIGLAALGFVSLAAAAAVGLVFARWVSHPIEALRQTTTRFGRGELSVRATTDAGPPEVRALGADFNATAKRLDELVSSQEQFVADASHQLRTPLTALRLRLEIVEDTLADEDASQAGGRATEIQEDMAAAHTEVQRLSRLVDGLLTLARTEPTSSTATAEPIELDGLVTERCTTWEPVAAERDVRLVARTERTVALATPDRVAQILDNLIANALDAAPEGSTVTVHAGPVTWSGETPGGQAQVGQVELSVSDEGPGLSAEQRTHAFDRFWRGDENTGGTGLGLAIVEKLARADGAHAELREAEGGGLTAVVCFRVGT